MEMGKLKFKRRDNMEKDEMCSKKTITVGEHRITIKPDGNTIWEWVLKEEVSIDGK